MATAVTTKPRSFDSGVVLRAQRSLWRDAFYRLLRNRAAVAGLIVIGIAATLRNTAFGQLMDGLLIIFCGIAVVGWVGLARLVRGQVLALKHREFIEAARAVGATPSRIMIKHLLPNILAPIIVTVAFAIPGAMLTESTLSFIGIGIRPPTATWGVMINEGFIVFSTSAWPVLLPSMCISIVLLAFTFVGDGLRDALDPRSKM